jgi:hypothetical protein
VRAFKCLSVSQWTNLFWGNNLSKSVTQSEEEIKQRIIDCLKNIEWDIMQGKIDTAVTKLEEAQKLTQEWGVKKRNSVSPYARAHPFSSFLHSLLPLIRMLFCLVICSIERWKLPLPCKVRGAINAQVCPLTYFRPALKCSPKNVNSKWKNLSIRTHHKWFERARNTAGASHLTCKTEKEMRICEVSLGF